MNNFQRIGMRSYFLFLLMVISIVVPCQVSGEENLSIKTLPHMLPYGAIDEEYKFELEAKGGTGELKWTNPGNTMPPGLILDPEGFIFGTPKNITAPVPPPDVTPYSFEVEVTDSATSPSSAKRTFALNIYKNSAARKAALDTNCFLAKGESVAIGDLGKYWSVGPTVTTQLFRYNLASEKASFNTPGLGIGAAFRLYLKKRYAGSSGGK